MRREAATHELIECHVGLCPFALLGGGAFYWVGLRGLHAAQSLFFVCAGLYLRVPKLGSRR